ncbi:MAG: sensor histidine kinase [Pirellulaceae bacterium]
MKYPAHYWLLYALALAVAASALAWLSREALILDRSEARARQQAELEDSIGRALWRMDVRMMPLIATEAARPHFLYQPFYVPPGGGGEKGTVPTVPSPLLSQRPEFVVLNFQLDADNRWTSPQLPAQQEWPRAVAAGVPQAELLRCAVQLEQLQQDVAYPQLVRELPEESIHSPATGSAPPASGVDDLAQQQIVVNEVSGADASPQDGASDLPQTGAYGPVEDASRLQRSQYRNSADLANRNLKFQSLAKQQYVQQRQELSEPSQPDVREGISRPVWIGERLLLARRITVSGTAMVQGCWLDWPSIKRDLLQEVAGLLASADLLPVTDAAQANVHRSLATLPVQLVVPEVEAAAGSWTPLRMSLGVAWICLGLAALCGGMLLHGLLTLSERRAAFVSAVTHELRTPLTTFRLYCEMLAQQMVPDAAKRQQYLETLRVEADRLGHLVENVLAYARLERGRGRRHRECLTVADIVERVASRFAERAQQAGMEWETTLDAADARLLVHTDPAAVEQILFNLVDNACKYAARAVDRRIHLRVVQQGRDIGFTVTDHGPGIAPDMVGRLFRPFSKSAQDAADSAPGVGLGLALSFRLARDLGGRLERVGMSQSGTSFCLVLPVSSPGQ